VTKSYYDHLADADRILDTLDDATLTQLVAYTDRLKQAARASKRSAVEAYNGDEAAEEVWRRGDPDRLAKALAEARVLEGHGEFLGVRTRFLLIEREDKRNREWKDTIAQALVVEDIDSTVRASQWSDKRRPAPGKLYSLGGRVVCKATKGAGGYWEVQRPQEVGYWSAEQERNADGELVWSYGQNKRLAEVPGIAVDWFVNSADGALSRLCRSLIKGEQVRD
jgi:hypothetical protein